MSITTTTVITDDITGEQDARTIAFAVAGAGYEIDLTQANASRLMNALAPFIAAARPAEVVARSGTSRSARAAGYDLAGVRAWAADNGHVLSDRGRVPAAVLEAYDAHHRTPKRRR